MDGKLLILKVELLKKRSMLFLQKQQSLEYHLDYNSSGETHGGDYWKIIKVNVPVVSIYGRIYHGGFKLFNNINNSLVYVYGTLMHQWGSMRKTHQL